MTAQKYLVTLWDEPCHFDGRQLIRGHHADVMFREQAVERIKATRAYRKAHGLTPFRYRVLPVTVI